MRNWKTSIGRVAASLVAIAALASLVTYETAKPTSARAAVAAPAPAAAPLDDNSVSTLLSLDQAMETLAAKVTPAIVNVAVTSRNKETAEQQTPDDLQQFFGPGFGQGFGPRGRNQQPQIEHGIGSGKMKYLQAEHGEEGVDLMRILKHAIDPKNIMNPGKIVAF